MRYTPAVWSGRSEGALLRDFYADHDHDHYAQMRHVEGLNTGRVCHGAANLIGQLGLYPRSSVLRASRRVDNPGR